MRRVGACAARQVKGTGSTTEMQGATQRRRSEAGFNKLLPRHDADSGRAVPARRTPQLLRLGAYSVLAVA